MRKAQYINRNYTFFFIKIQIFKLNLATEQCSTSIVPIWKRFKLITQYIDNLSVFQSGVPSAVRFGVPAVKKENLINTKEASANEAVWNPGLRRCGVIARKIGQYPLWLKNGERIRTTLLQIADNHVIKYIPPEEYVPAQTPNVKNLHKRGCILVGSESTNPALLTKEYTGLFRDSGVVPKKNLARFIVSPEAQLEPGTPLNVNHFGIGDFVDVRGKT